LLENVNFKKASILDIGCGRKSIVSKICKRGYTVGVDGYKPYILESKRKKIHDDYVLLDIQHLCFIKKSFDTVIMLDVLEHLPKESGEKEIMEMEFIAKKSTVILTPNGFVKQGARDGNLYQRHLSSWTAMELGDAGFRIKGINGFKIFFKEECKPRINHPLCRLMIIFSQFIAYNYPQLAYHVLAIKKV
jgi:2-polyprenyl-3-methyl-5-hydroxy-6-metoxy-1,4-benzoquinol methylase